MSLANMLPFSLADRTGAFNKSHSQFSPNKKPCSNFMNSDGGSLLGSFTLKRISALHVKTELYTDAGNTSPPPPALSPANSSPPHLPDSAFNQTSSPSPPIIVAEIESNSSGVSSVKNDNHALSFKNIKSPLSRTGFRNTSSLPAKVSTVPRINSLSSSCSSSSSSTSSSSACNEYIGQSSNGLPILEKISRVLGSPKISSITAQSMPPKEVLCHPTVAHSSGNQNSEASFELPISPLPLSSENPGDLRTSDKPDLLTSKPSTSKPKRKRQASTSLRKPKRNKKSKLIYSDSDFESDMVRVGHASRPRSAARTKRTGNRLSCHNTETQKASQSSGSAEAIAYKRYLESPFLCLCQSHGTVLGLSQTPSVPGSTQKEESAVPSSDSIAFSAALPAHVVSPALRGISTASGAGNSIIHPSIPTNCPLNRARAADHLGVDMYQEQGEVRTIFSGLTYRPSTQIRSRELPALSEITPTRPWLCVFCGQDNTFLDLGSLYGPYWLSDVERLQLPPGLIDSPSGTSATPQADTVIPAVKSENLPERSGKKVRSGIITSAVTRSAAAEGRATVAKTGELRLIIKARSSQASQPSAKHRLPSEPSIPPRISSTGEVWFHVDCLLWAPGTCVNGSGTIPGLEEAVQLALDTTCSNCDKLGAVLSCCSRGCNLSFHFHCAVSAGCQLNYDQFSLLCKTHKTSI